MHNSRVRLSNEGLPLQICCTSPEPFEGSEAEHFEPQEAECDLEHPNCYDDIEQFDPFKFAKPPKTVPIKKERTDNGLT